MITRIEASNVFCFTTFEMDVPADGTIIEGANAKGKTSVLNLIRVALVEKGATKDMIRRVVLHLQQSRFKMHHFSSSKSESWPVWPGARGFGRHERRSS
mgnify:CR=1 FL=1